MLFVSRSLHAPPVYQNTLAAVQYNGRVSRFFEVSRGVRQGCPLSPLLYVFGAEILARAIRANKKKIKGIPTGKNQRFKISQFADDTALGVESEEETNEVEKTIQHFEKESGARLNREKRVCAMGLGEWNKRDSTGQSFKWVNQTAYLGVFVGKDMLQAMKDTWQKVTRKLKTAVNLWKGRTLSLRGKALVINTWMVSRTVYTASVFPMPTETLTEINRVTWLFLWDNSPDFVPCEQATRSLSEGGLGIVDIPDKARSIGMRAIELFRSTAVEYDRLKEKPCWIVLAEQRLEAELNVAEILKNYGQGQDWNSKTGPRPIRKVFGNVRQRH